MKTILLILTLAAAALAHGTHFVKIVDAKGKPVAGAAVTVGGVEQKTDANGVIGFATEGCNCEIKVKAKGFKPLDSTVESYNHDPSQVRLTADAKDSAFVRWPLFGLLGIGAMTLVYRKRK